MRRREWKKLAEDPNSPLTPAQREEIRQRGRGPQRVNPETGEVETMALSHEPVSRGQGGERVVPRWKDEHAAIDPDRYLKGQTKADKLKLIKPTATQPAPTPTPTPPPSPLLEEPR
jgi:hypothetical protein